MKIRILFILSFLVGSSILFSQEVTLKKIYSTGKYYDMTQPIILDSLNIRGEKFDNKNMLESFISVPNESAFNEHLNADITGYFPLSKARIGFRFHLLAFNIHVDKFAKTNVRITAPSMFEAYINGVKESSKISIEDTLTSSKTVKMNFPCQPGTYRILIKYLSIATNKSPEGVKITIESDNKSSKINYIFGNNDKRNITIKDILEGKRITNASMSANGQYVLLNYITTKDDGKSLSETELFNVRTQKRISLSNDKNYAWMPFSSQLYYSDNTKGVTQLVILNPEGLEESVLAYDIPSGNFIFTPDEKTLLFTEKESPDPIKGDLIRLTSPEDRQPEYKNRYYLSKYNLTTGVKQRLTFAYNSMQLHSISNDSRYILYSISENVPTQRPFFLTSMYKLDLQTLTQDTIWQKEGFADGAKFSPDGKSILIEGSGEAFGGIGQNIAEGQIANSYNKLGFIMDLDTRQIDPFTRLFNPSIDDSFWNPVDGLIYLSVTDQDYERIYSYDPRKKQFKQLNLSEDVIKSVSYASSSAYAVYAGVSESNSTRSYILDLKNERSTLISDPYKERLEKLNISAVKDWNFTASDGTTIYGRYYLPPNFDTSKKYPMIVYYYGGTMPTSRTLEAPYPSHVYAALGYVVYVLQPSGATGFGQEFAARHVNAWGKRTADDIVEGTKHFLSEHPFVDSSRVGCIGASYGGFMTMYLQTYTNLFAAAVSHAGISSISSYWGEGYWGYTYSSGASAYSYPWNNRDLYVDQSPLFNADKVNTPILLLHGTEDTNVPIGESIQMYTALKVLGKPVEFIQVKGENHGIRDFKKRIEWNYSIYAWFAKWLQNDSTWWDSLYPRP